MQHTAPHSCLHGSRDLGDRRTHGMGEAQGRFAFARLALFRTTGASGVARRLDVADGARTSADEGFRGNSTACLRWQAGAGRRDPRSRKRQRRPWGPAVNACRCRPPRADGMSAPLYRYPEPAGKPEASRPGSATLMIRLLPIVETSSTRVHSIHGTFVSFTRAGHRERTHDFLCTESIREHDGAIGASMDIGHHGPGRFDDRLRIRRRDRRPGGLDDRRASRGDPAEVLL